VESWEGNCLDGAPDVLLKLVPTQDTYSFLAKKTESSNPSQSGMISKPSTGSRGKAQSISLPADFLAKISARREKERESKKSEAGCGWKWQGSFAKFNHDTHSWRTRQVSLLGGLEEFSATWPNWGSMQDGECLEQITLGHHTSVRGSGLLLPTPTASQNGSSNNGKRGDGTTFKTAGKPSLSTMASRNAWPTPRATDWKGCVKPSKLTARRINERGGRATLSEAMQEKSNPLGSDAREPSGWWSVEPNVGRVAHGVPSRMDRLKTLGNGQVPAVVKLAWSLLNGKTNAR